MKDSTSSKDPDLGREEERNKIENLNKLSSINLFQTDKSERRVLLIRIIIETILSIILLALFIFLWFYYDTKWETLFFMTLWSFWMNTYYIISITVIDYFIYIKNKKFEKYEDFVRNHYIRIAFPFAIGIVFLYWMLILLGDEFEYRGREVMDTGTGLLFHGTIFVIILFDVCAAHHVNKKHYLLDLGIITFMIIVYYIVLGIGKYLILFEPYDFMTMSNVRQIIAACILIYIVILDGYVVLYLIAKYFFEQEDENNFDKLENNDKNEANHEKNNKNNKK